VLPVEDDEAWFISQRRAPFGASILEVPAGKLDSSDHHPEAAAARELREELGAEADEWIPLTASYTSPGYTDEVLYLFAARGLRFFERHLQGAEETESTLIRLPIDEAVSRIECGLIRDAKTQVAVLMWARRKDRL
jgi:ADP-ribose pyrophosphatase